MLLLSKLGWDVSGVTAFDFVDHLMERLPSTTSSNAILRAHALTHVSLCCTGTYRKRGCVPFVKKIRERERQADDPGSCVIIMMMIIKGIEQQQQWWWWWRTCC